MGGRGSSSGLWTLSAEERSKISIGIASHSVSDNDRAERNFKQSIQTEKDIISNAEAYIRVGYVQSTEDEWFQNHLKAYEALIEKYSYFKQERKKQGR